MNEKNSDTMIGEMIEIKLMQQRILSHHEDFKNNFKEVGKKFDAVNDKVDDLKDSLGSRIHDIEKDLVGVKTKIAIFTAMGSGVGVFVGWLLSAVKFLKS